jgi:putative CocE/NonD family hydrolase
MGGATDFPDGAFDDFGYAMAWHDRWLRGAAALPSQEIPVIVYVMGANRWRAEDAWPLPGTQVVSYCLRGDGGLSSTAASDDEPPDQYTYDPRLTVPTPAMGRVAVTELLERDDVLVYATPPLTEPVEVTGEISATLFAASSANDTDWMVRLVDVQPDGQAFQVVDGVMRARYRHSRTQPAPLTTDRVEQYEINMWATSLVVDRGHRIAVVISSSNFPRYDRHPNVFADLRKTTEADFVPAIQTVYHSTEYPSAIHLPIVRISEHQRWIANPMPL